MFLMLYLTRQFDKVIDYGMELREILQSDDSNAENTDNGDRTGRMSFTTALTLIMSLLRRGRDYDTVEVIKDELK